MEFLGEASGSPRDAIELAAIAAIFLHDTELTLSRLRLYLARARARSASPSTYNHFTSDCSRRISQCSYIMYRYQKQANEHSLLALCSFNFLFARPKSILSLRGLLWVQFLVLVCARRRWMLVCLSLFLVLKDTNGNIASVSILPLHLCYYGFGR